MTYWRCPPLWKGKSAFLVGAGPSVREIDLGKLRGQHVVALKDMWHLVPFAEFMLFSDESWMPNVVDRPAGFSGAVVTVASNAPPSAFRMRRGDIKGIAEDPDTLNGRYTVAHFGLNLLRHLGPSRVGVLGVDLALGADGVTRARQPHEVRSDLFLKMAADLLTVVAPLRAAGIDVFNCTPGGALDLWPRCTIEALL